jgi:DNA-directed RNA polymerase specialized sigma24 family protein
MEGARSRTVVAMTTDALRPFDKLARDWEARRRTSASRDALAVLARAEPEVAGLAASDLGDLVEALTGPRRATGAAERPPGERDRAAALFRAALRSGHVHPLVSRALVQALVPGLVGVGRRLAWGKGGEWEDQAGFTVDAIATAWEIVESWSGQDRPYAVLDVLSAIRCRLRRRIVRHHAQQRTEQLARNDEVTAEPVATGHSAEEDLARAIERERHHLDPDAAFVLYAHRVLGYSLSELSSSSGHSRRYLAERRDRAVAALIS